MHTFRLSMTMLLRDLRAGELTLLGLALFIAIVSLSSVCFFTDRLQQGLEREANQLLGGDLLVASDHPLSKEFEEYAQKSGLKQTQTRLFASMVSTDDVAQLAAVKVIEPGYPLRGSLKISSGMGQEAIEAGRIPGQGEIWLDERLMSSLHVKLGDTIQLGNQHFRLGALVAFESDRGSNFFSLTPRAIINASDLATTGLIQEGSRVAYRFQLAGEKPAIDAYKKWLKSHLERGEHMESIENARPEIRSGLDRANQFLRLAAMLTVVLAAVAMGLSSRRYLQRHLNSCAVMRCCGAQRSQLLGMFAAEFGVFALFLALLGCAAGYALQAALMHMAASVISTDLPAPGILPWLYGPLTALVLIAGFVLPHILRLTRVPPIHVLRREWRALELSSSSAWVLGGMALTALLFWVAGSLKLGAYVVGGLALSGFIFAVLAKVLLSALAQQRHRFSLWGVHYGLAAMNRRMGSSVVQIVALALGTTAILLLTLVTQDLVTSWRKNQAPDRPNQFILNIQPEQIKPLSTFFTSQNLSAPEMLPMVRGRLIEINGQPVKGSDYKEDRARRLAEREFSLSFGNSLQKGNRIIKGTWHGNQNTHDFSMEEGIGKTLGVKLGDNVAFEIGGQRVEGKVGSVRKLDWDSMQVNFFFVAASGMLESYPASYITSFYLPQNKNTVVTNMVAAFPNLTVVDIGAVMAQVVEMAHKLIDVVNFVLAFSLVAGVLVLFAALHTTHDERIYEISVLRTLGARNAQLRVAMLIEFFILGTIVAFLSVFAALGIGYTLSNTVFDLVYQPNFASLLKYAIIVVLSVMLTGWLGVRQLLTLTVKQGLEQGA